MNRFLPALAALVLSMPVLAAAQSASVVADEVLLRKQPSGETPGVAVARMLQNANVEILTVRGAWREVVVEGWIWTESVGPEDQDGYDLVVVREGGENLRDEPNGRIAARFFDGALLEHLEERGGWTRVRRIGWLWFQTLSETQTAATDSGSAPASEPAAVSDDEGGTEHASAHGDLAEEMAALMEAARSVQEDSPAGTEPTGDAAAGHLEVGPDGVDVLASRAGSRIASIEPGTHIAVLENEDGWVRVQVEGWVRLPDSDGAARDRTGAASAGTDAAATTYVGVRELRTASGQFDGRLLQWDVEFVSLLRADAMRTDFTEGEPFILARSRTDTEGFAYLAVPPDLVNYAEALMPLQNLRVTGRVRRRSSPNIGNPILDLLTIEEIQ